MSKFWAKDEEETDIYYNLFSLLASFRDFLFVMEHLYPSITIICQNSRKTYIFL